MRHFRNNQRYFPNILLVLLVFILAVTTALFACSKGSDLDTVVKKDAALTTYIENLKTTSMVYKSCADCRLSGYDGVDLIGYTDRYPPKGHYDRKVIRMGTFKYDAFLVSDSLSNERDGYLYVCYFTKAQKEKFTDFWSYYLNRIQHGKQLAKVNYINNTAIIIIENQG